jgi:hypothetical protein
MNQHIDTSTYPVWIDALDALLSRRFNRGVLDYIYDYERAYSAGLSVRTTCLSVLECGVVAAP